MDAATAPARLPTLAMDTNSLPPFVRFTLFRLRASRTVDISLHNEPGETFRICARAWFFGDSLLASIETFCRMQLVRTRRHVDRSVSDQCSLILFHTGGLAGEADDAAAAASAGDIILFDRSRPIDVFAPRSRITCLIIRRDRIAPFLPAGVLPHGLVIPGAAGALLADFFRSLERQAPALTLEEARHIERGACEMVIACIAPSQERLTAANAQLEQSWRIEAKRFIDAELADPGLGPDDVARRLGLSRSKLYRLFDGEEGGVAALIRRRRLRAACRALLDPKDRRRISDIAYACGFRSETHFSRAFREEFDMAPSAWRDAGGTAAVEPHDGEDRIAAETMHNWLARLD